MKTIFVLDWYTCKYYQVDQVEDDQFSSLSYGDKIVYEIQELDGKDLSVGTYLGYSIECDRIAHFQRKLEGSEAQYFDEQQKFAQSFFPLFRKTFKESFLGSKPVSARYHVFSHQVYFYFYSEERYAFSDYVKFLREKVGKNIFLFQVGARDMVRLSPSSKDFLDLDGRPLHASMSWPLPTISMDILMLQNLDGRDVERLKGRSGKLKESLVYESGLYQEESHKYPTRGSKVQMKDGNFGVCLSFNIMNGDVTVKTDENEIMRIPVSLLKFEKL